MRRILEVKAAVFNALKGVYNPWISWQKIVIYQLKFLEVGMYNGYLFSIDSSIKSQLMVRLVAGGIPQPLINWCNAVGDKASWLDFNGDKRLDLMCDTASGTHKVLLNDIDALLSITGDIESKLGVRLNPVSAPIPLTNWCASTDGNLTWVNFNGDNKPDAACSTSSGTYMVLLNYGATSLLSITGDILSRLPLKVNPNAMPVTLSGWCLPRIGKASWVDTNGDKRVDLVCDTFNGTHHLLLNDGNALLSVTGDGDSQLLMKVKSTAKPMSLVKWCTNVDADPVWANFGGNGRADLICNNIIDGKYHVLLSNTDFDAFSLISASGASDGVLGYTGLKHGIFKSLDFR